MTNSEFKWWYNEAKKGGNVVNDSTFLAAGYFWINLTERQIKKMADLMISQGAEVKDGWIELVNGLRIKAN